MNTEDFSTDKFVDVFLRPRVRLFLSIDIVGSTAAKQGQFNSIETIIADWKDDKRVRPKAWMKVSRFLIGRFFPMFLQFWNSESPEYKGSDNEVFSNPRLFKVLGDEIIITATFTEEKKLLGLISCFMMTLREFRVKLREIESTFDIKGTIWAAGFPVLNEEVAVPILFQNSESEDLIDSEAYSSLYNLYSSEVSGEANEYLLDYVGPQVDIGFRISALSTARKIAVSIEVAYLIAHVKRKKGEAHKSLQMPLSEIDLKFLDRTTMKGVSSGIAYPVFYIDLAAVTNYFGEWYEKESNFLMIEDGFLSRPPQITSDLIIYYLDQFYTDNNRRHSKPFLIRSGNTDINQSNIDYGDYTNQLKHSLKKDLESQNRGDEKEETDGKEGAIQTPKQIISK